MSPSAIVYASATGFTRRYADLLSERTGLPCFALGAVPGPDRGAAVLYLGWLCAGGIKGLRKARARYKVQAVCAVGMSPAGTAYTDQVRAQNHLENLPFFYLRGGYAPDRLTGPYKWAMSAMARMVTQNPPKDDQERAVQEAFRQGGDWVDEAYLDPVLDWLSRQG